MTTKFTASFQLADIEVVAAVVVEHQCSYFSALDSTYSLIPLSLHLLVKAPTSDFFTQSSSKDLAAKRPVDDALRSSKDL